MIVVLQFYSAISMEMETETTMHSAALLRILFPITKPDSRWAHAGAHVLLVRLPLHVPGIAAPSENHEKTLVFTWFSEGHPKPEIPEICFAKYIVYSETNTGIYHVFHFEIYIGIFGMNSEFYFQLHFRMDEIHCN